MNRNITNVIRLIMDDWLPPVIRDHRFFMYPFFYVWFKGKNIKTYMEFKSLVYSLSDQEFEEIYRALDCLGSDRPTDLNQPCLDHILTHLDPNAKTLMDVGCGRGYFLDQVAAQGRYQVYGCDVLDQVPLANGTYHQANIEHLPFEDQQFDIVVCSHTLEHVRNLERAIAELKRIAKKQIVVVVPCQRYYYYTLDLHINFFPIAAILENAMQLDHYTCRNLWGDWVYIGYLNR